MSGRTFGRRAGAEEIPITRARDALPDHAVPVRLNPIEYQLAIIVGGTRRTEAMRNQRLQSYGFVARNQVSFEAEGAGAELAVAKLLGRYWNALMMHFSREDPDVEPDIQVRLRFNASRGLLVHETDPDHQRYVLVTGENASYHVVGWIEGHEAKRPEWQGRDNRHPRSYAVPPHSLHPIRTLALSLGVHLQEPTRE